MRIIWGDVMKKKYIDLKTPTEALIFKNTDPERLLLLKMLLLPEKEK